MRVLVIQPWIRLGGAELISVHLAHELRKQGHNARIVCTFAELAGMPSQANEVEYALPPRWLSVMCRRSRLLFLLVGPWLLLALTLKHARGIDVLNPHNFPASWVAVLVGALRRIPVVWTCNEPPERLPWRDGLKVGLGDYLGWLAASSWLDRVLVRQVSLIYVPSERTRLQVVERYGRDAKVIYLGTDVDFFKGSNGSDLDRNHDLQGKFVLLSVGKLHQQKNQLLCLRALRTVLKEIPATVLVLAGDGPMFDEWRSLAKEWGLAAHVRFLGHVGATEVRDLYRLCDVNIFPAVNQSWGFTPFEALCARRISIVSDDCGAAEVLAREEIGLVCEATEEAFSQQILAVHQSPKAYREMAERGRNFVLQELTWDKHTQWVGALMETHALSTKHSNREAGAKATRI